MRYFAMGLLFALSLMANLPAHAYLDPGSGSMLLQALLGGFAGIAVLLSYFWKQIIAFLPFSKKAIKSEDLHQETEDVVTSKKADV